LPFPAQFRFVVCLECCSPQAALMSKRQTDRLWSIFRGSQGTIMLGKR
jgi:hypothetical protein